VALMTLRIERLVHGYGRRHLFNGFNAEAVPGITWVQGANGSGKSTLLRLLAGCERPQLGGFELAGERFDAADAEAPLRWRQQTFWCASEPPPTPWLTLAETLSFVSSAWPGADPQALQAQVQAFGLSDALNTRVSDASLGQQRKTLLSLALALPVRLLLLDEPFNALDRAAQAHLARALAERAAQRQQVLLLTSHVEPQVEVQHRWALA